MTVQKSHDPKATPTSPQTTGKSERKPWKKKSPFEVFLGQADKLKAEIAEMEEDLKNKKRQLEKFEQARKLFDAS
jgi:hypothetical protein